MLRKTFSIITCIIISSSLMTNHAHARIKYGLWEITVTPVMDSSPVEDPASTIKQCITSKNLTPGDKKDQEGCKTYNVTRKGDTVSWTVNCTRDKHTMSGRGEVTYEKNKMSGHAQFQAGGKGLATMKMQLQYSGRYLGRCK